MTKKEVQKRVLQNGKMLPLNKFTWDEKTKTFSTNENDLIIDFNGIDNCTFNTGSNCTFKTGSNCTFKTGDNCTFNTSSYCTFNIGNECVVVRRDIFQVISNKKEIKLCPYNIPGYLEKINDKWYLNGDEKQGEHIIVDGILSKIISHKGNVYKVINYDEYEETFILTNGSEWAHGKTIEDAKDSLIYKIGNRDKSDYKSMTIDTEYTLEDAIKMYRVITGSCELGVRNFIKTIQLKEKYTVKEIITLTEGQYGNDELRRFLEECRK